MGKINLKHIKISLLPRYLETGENHSNHYQSHGESFCLVLAFFFPLHSPSWQLHSVWSQRLTGGTQKPSVDFQKHWCTANLLEACTRKSPSHFCTPQSSTIARLLLSCLSQAGSGNCCLPQCENETDSQGVLKHSSCQTNLIIPFSKHYRIRGWREWDSVMMPDFNFKKPHL